jgi:23S rRNA C2498 (ribose-2'-O)-methylase RlmM
MNNNRYFYFLCNEGSEPFLKEEIAFFHPELRFSYSTKGFVTFKLIESKLRHTEFIFCRHYGEFVQKGKTFEELKPSWEKSNVRLYYNLAGENFYEQKLNLADEVLEIIQIKENEYYLGKFHVKNKSNTFIGGRLNLSLPIEAPSRAYLKILEGALKVGISFSSDENALEIGSSPGGATYALLEKGLNVIGVDPGVMDPICLNHKNFKHFKNSIQDFKPEQIQQKVDWLLVDMNLAPEATLNEIEKILLEIESEMKGAFITLKLTKFSLVSKIQFYKKILIRLGFSPEYLTQLPSHKQEFLMYVTRN